MRGYYEDVLRFHTIACSTYAQREDAMQEELETYEPQGLIQKADTIEELAEKLGFEGEDRENFLATVEAYNAGSMFSGTYPATCPARATARPWSRASRPSSRWAVLSRASRQKPLM